MAAGRRRLLAAVLLTMGTWVAVSANFLVNDLEWAVELPAADDFGSMDLSASSTTIFSTTPSSSSGQGPWDSSLLPSSRFSKERSRRRRGKVTFDLRGTKFSLGVPQQPGGENNAVQEPTQDVSNDEPVSNPQEQVTLSIDPASTVRLIRLLAEASFNFAAAFMGTLRLLAPLIVARRALNAVGDLGMDYMRGRYLRTTYSRLERIYVRYYELPSAFRAMCRTLAQLAILVFLSGIMGWMVGLHHTPCSVDGSCPRMWCALLWIVAVVGTGHACSTAVAVWGGPLRIQVAASHMHTGRSLAARIFTRPWHILQWMQDPEQWITMISTPQTTVQQAFAPDPILYPATWVPLRFLQMVAVAKAAASVPKTWPTSRDPARTIMWSLLVEIALADEWYRVFIGERRVGLGVAVSFVYMVASMSLAVTAATMDYTAAIMLIPTVLAVSVSGWMNVAIFWNRLEVRRRRATISAFNERRQAALRALKWE